MNLGEVAEPRVVEWREEGMLEIDLCQQGIAVCVGFFHTDRPSADQG